ncbi:hypothetical protein ACFS3C_12925 [Azotobacter vinelandii]
MSSSDWFQWCRSGMASSKKYCWIGSSAVSPLSGTLVNMHTAFVA